METEEKRKKFKSNDSSGNIAKEGSTVTMYLYKGNLYTSNCVSTGGLRGAYGASINSSAIFFFRFLV